MGFLRLALAVSVVAAHTGYGLWLDGRAAVLIFYVISGYLIALVVNGPYRENNAAFYLNRALRIFIPALVVMAVSAIALLAVHQPNPAVASPVSWVRIYSLFTNVFIIGQDTAWLFGVNNSGSLVWSPYGANGNAAIQLFNYQYNLPMFTIAIELYFYLFAPFVLRSIQRTIIFGLIGTAYHLLVFANAPNSLALSYHFFMASFFYFAAGGLVFHLYNRPPFKSIYIVLIFMIISEVIFESAGNRAAFICVIFGLPALIEISSRLKIDQFIGSLSYLVYLVHWPIRSILLAGWEPGLQYFAATASLSLLSAIVLHLAVEQPLDRLRERIRSRRKYSSPVAMKSAECQDDNWNSKA